MTSRSYLWLHVFLLTLCLIAVQALPGAAEESARDSLWSDVKNVFAEKCFACHGRLKQEANLRLETRSLIQTGGESGSALNLQQPKHSLLWERVTAEVDMRMPPEGEGSALTPEELQQLERWLEIGAPAPEEPTPPSPLEHWAFKSPSRKEALCFDELLESKQVAAGLVVNLPADRPLAIRRLYYDLIGLPPTLEQLQDTRPWEDLVDELLASPHYGERWGRHWMDVWRYSDNYGLNAQLRYSQKHMWHWRDWIVSSLNQDKGYDRMLLEMLAGDELEPLDQNVVAGTGFLARNYYLFNRTTWLDATIEHTGKAFLGLTLNCAKCHDHKYDPISQRDYYNFRAIFEPHQVRLDPVAGELDFDKDGLPRVFDDHLDAQTFLHIRGDEKKPDTELAVQPSVPELFAEFQPKSVWIDLPFEAYSPGARRPVQAAALAAAESKLSQARKSVASAESSLAEGKVNASKLGKDDSFESNFELSEEFDGPNENWELVGRGWKYSDGKLLQSQSSRETLAVRLVPPVPRDFEFEADYVTTGGGLYKSISFQFDSSEDRKYRNFVYSSAHAPGPKIQFAYDRAGVSSYPASGRSSQEIEVGKRIKLRFAIRDRLANVWLDGKFLLAFQYPSRREGAFEIAAFDATVALERIRLRALPSGLELQEPATGTSPSDASPKTRLEIANRNLAACEAEVAALRAVIAADNAKKAGVGVDVTSAELRQLGVQAARAQRDARRLRAEHDKLAFREKDARKSQAATKLLEHLKQSAAESDEAEYRSIRASLKALETPEHKESDYPDSYSSQSTGRRLSLARWLVDQRNPLTARVAVNHIWMRHFGTPLVESVSDFGLRAPEPIHRDVLDFLACELMESGWSMKHLHRLIVTSKAYQRSSLAGDESNQRIDRDNVYLWRMNSRRMESQVLRDSLLSLGGELDLNLGGPSLAVGSGKRRSIYFRHSRDDKDKFLAAFDDADFLQCYRRQESVLPQQALALSNSKLANEMADKIARRLADLEGEPVFERFAATAFELLLGRKATESELSECEDFRSDLVKLYSDLPNPEREARAQTRLIHVLLNHNDFVSIR